MLAKPVHSLVHRRIFRTRTITPGVAHGGGEDAIEALARSHAELVRAVRTAGRWILHRSAYQHDLEVLEQLRGALLNAEAFSTSRSYKQPVQDGQAGENKILVMPKRQI